MWVGESARDRTVAGALAGVGLAPRREQRARGSAGSSNSKCKPEAESRDTRAEDMNRQVGDAQAKPHTTGNGN